MNKSELVEKIAHNADLSKAGAGRALEAALSAITCCLRKGGAVQIKGFGTFRLVKKAARAGRNPRTGEPLKIKARRTAKFTPGTDLKQSLN